ncbi:hypothetical protein P7B02_12900 [Caulobacter segnis]|uniref:hypothetical protein n=1 Tax=Caulobacter segnis TaxID=88688 RepID=UPI00240F87EF|nr:hypothetical protein [Caulobacter segnis]MDG2522444.1 hypothetical protein [Caulobacter segnis]
MKRSFLFTAGVVCVAGLALAACGPDGKPPKPSNNHWNDKASTVKARLECPDKQGELTRVSVAPDGKSCTYTAKDAEVVIRHLPVGPEGAQAALAPIENDLRTIVPFEVRKPTPGGKHTEINLPGLHITAHDDEGGDGGAAEVRVAGIHINANENGAEIRAEHFGENAVRASLILAAGDDAPEQHVVGYEARGPANGPLVVAVVKAKDRDYTDNKDKDGVFSSMKKLVRMNVDEK